MNSHGHDPLGQDRSDRGARAFALLVAYNNIVDYDSNYQFVRHVLSMDTIFPDSSLRSRAIDSEAMWRAAYGLIIATEALTGLLLALGAVVLLGRLTAPGKTFNQAKLWAVAGLTVGFCLWFFGFVAIGGEYFAMWQSKLWNGQDASFRIAGAMLAALIFVSLPDGEIV
jgi:predicted small integral membrane protein